MWLVRVHRVPADRPILAAIKRVELRHVVCVEGKVVQLRVGPDARGGRALRERDEAAACLELVSVMGAKQDENVPALERPAEKYLGRISVIL
jgi:hypothetical protein